jgi:hypothetical protein
MEIILASGQKKCTGTAGAFFYAAVAGSSLETAAGFLAFGLGALDPALAGARILAGATGGRGSAGTGALAGIDVVAFAGFFGRGCAHRRGGEHGSSGCGKGDTGGLFSFKHENILKY